MLNPDSTSTVSDPVRILFFISNDRPLQHKTDQQNSDDGNQADRTAGHKSCYKRQANNGDDPQNQCLDRHGQPTPSFVSDKIVYGCFFNQFLRETSIGNEYEAWLPKIRGEYSTRILKKRPDSLIIERRETIRGKKENTTDVDQSGSF